MTTIYAVKVDKTDPYFDDPEAIQFLGENTDPAVPYRRLQKFPASVASLVKRDGDGEWTPVNGIDQHCIGMRAKHDIMKKQALVDGYGWARCTCGWQDERSYESGYAAPDYEASAARHMADVDARIKRFREILRYIPRTPDQEACPHVHDETRDSLTPGIREWRCRDCGLHIQFSLEIAS